MNKNSFKVKNKIWLYPGDAAWHFVTVPPEISKRIDEKFSKKKKGFGSLKVQVKIGKTKFLTSIFPNRKDGTYLLPIKKEVRKKESLQEGEVIDFTIKIC